MKGYWEGGVVPKVWFTILDVRDKK